MFIAFVYGNFSVGNRPFNFGKLWTDPRGLTGSEVSCFSFAREMARRGHNVAIFTRYESRSPMTWEGCNVFDLDELHETSSAHFDVVYSWNEPDVHRRVSTKCVRAVNQQLNDFAYCIQQPHFDQYVDVYTSPSENHRDHIMAGHHLQHKTEILYNGCDISQYPNIDRVPGRVIYASSPDRGLHLLLQEWPKIKKAVPHAHLRVFYNFAPWYAAVVNNSYDPRPHVRENCYRAMYIKECMERLKSYDVDHRHSISRVQMASEMAEAEVLAYPCEILNDYTEGFSVTLMEACASGVLPVTSSVDALGSLYGDVTPIVPAPARDHMDLMVANVIRGLKDEEWRNGWTSKSKAHAKQFQWSVLCEKLEAIMTPRIIAKQKRK